MADSSRLPLNPFKPPPRSNPAPIKTTTARFNQNPDRQSLSTNNNNENSASNPTAAGPSTSNGIIQPKPQPLTKRTAPSAIIVSPRQKGNPILSAIKSIPWEYGDIPADYTLGLTTCALFLSLKYHRLHPEYIYTRIKALQGKYSLRLVLVMVDIQNHEESLRELSKTSLINNVTLILTWSAAEGGRYLELFKSYENASSASIRQHQSTAYSDRMIDFITTPRSIHKTDAVALVSQFGTLRTAVNAREEEVGGIAGWGEKKVVRWCRAVREPFRVQRAKGRGLGREESEVSGFGREDSGASALGDDEERVRGGSRDGTDVPSANTEAPRAGPSTNALPLSPAVGIGLSDADQRPDTRLAETIPADDIINDAEDSLFVPQDDRPEEALIGASIPPAAKSMGANEQIVPRKRQREDDALNDGVMAALSKLRKDGG